MTDNPIRPRPARRLARFFVAALGAVVPFAASNAEASPGRTLCPAGAMVNNNLPTTSLYWGASGQCQVRATGTAAWSSSSAVYGSISFPLQTGSTSVTTFTPDVWAHGGSGTASNGPRAAACAYVFDSAGNLSSSTSIKQTFIVGPENAVDQELLGFESLTMPAGGSFTVNFAAQKGAGINMVSASWTGSSQPP